MNDTQIDVVLHSSLSRVDQFAVCALAAYPDEIDVFAIINKFERLGLARQNRSRLLTKLKSSGFFVQGKSKSALRLHHAKKADIESRLGSVITIKPRITVDDDSVPLPTGSIPLSRRYIAAIVKQINEGYACQHFDSVAVMMRRLTESLLIEVFIHAKKADAIKDQGTFVPLETLVTRIKADREINTSRGLERSIIAVKRLGDSAAHSLSHITLKADVDLVLHEFRRYVSELVQLSKLS